MQSSSKAINNGTLPDMLWGYSLDVWDRAGVVLMFIGAGLGVIALLLSLASAYVLYEVADAAQKQTAKEARSSGEKIAVLNNETARLTADNLALQTVMLPRHVGIIGINKPPEALQWFAGMEAFTNTEFVVVAADDPEARNLANEIVIALRLFGLNAKIDENRTVGGAARIPNGISVSYPIGRTWTSQEPNQPWFEWAKAANALANGLTKAGLGIGSSPVSRYGFQPQPTNAQVSFNPVREGVLVLVGSRPIGETVEWIRSGRLDAAGNPPSDIPKQ
jgi:hypothetical protein